MSKSYKALVTSPKDRKFISFSGADRFLGRMETARIPVTTTHLFDFPATGLEWDGKVLMLGDGAVGMVPVNISGALNRFGYRYEAKALPEPSGDVIRIDFERMKVPVKRGGGFDEDLRHWQG